MIILFHIKIQVIPARPGMVGFGFVLTAGTDIDNNGYPGN